ncbi:MAG: hypothetical protein EXR98_09710 [Gemmataceae bacterium]|nr:hypothetical protein [Gemmataceae bacterium]
MLANYRILALIALSLLAGNAPAQTVLQWKFAKGQVYAAQRTATQKQIVEIKGKIFKQVSASIWHVRLEVQEKKADGFAIQATLTKVEQRITGAADAEMIDPKLHEKMQGAVFALIVKPTGAIYEMRGYEDFLTRLRGTDKARLKALRVTFPEAAVKEALADVFGPLPEVGVKPGDAWRRDYFEPIPHFGGLRASVRYVYVGPIQERERITYTIQTKYEIPKDGANGIFRIAEGSIESEKANGTIHFDRAAGRLVEHERSMLLRGKLTIETMDRRQELEFSSENELKLRVQPAAK